MTTSNLFTLITSDAPYQDRFLYSFAVDPRYVRRASKPLPAADPTLTGAELLAAAEKDHPLFAAADPTTASAERILATAVAKESPAEK